MVKPRHVRSHLIARTARRIWIYLQNTTLRRLRCVQNSTVKSDLISDRTLLQLTILVKATMIVLLMQVCISEETRDGSPYLPDSDRLEFDTKYMHVSGVHNGANDVGTGAQTCVKVEYMTNRTAKEFDKVYAFVHAQICRYEEGK